MIIGLNDEAYDIMNYSNVYSECGAREVVTIEAATVTRLLGPRTVAKPRVPTQSEALIPVIQYGGAVKEGM